MLPSVRRMKNKRLTSPPPPTRQQLIGLLNRDLACEYRAIIAYIVYSEVLKRASYTVIAHELERHAADEFQHAKAIADQITHLGGIPCAMLKAVMPRSVVTDLCHVERDTDVTTVGNFRYPANSCSSQASASSASVTARPWCSSTNACCT